MLDIVLGGDHASLFRRKQLKALVTIHAKDEVGAAVALPA